MDIRRMLKEPAYCAEVCCAKKGATEADKEALELLCNITAQEKDCDGIRTEFCDIHQTL